MTLSGAGLNVEYTMMSRIIRNSNTIDIKILNILKVELGQLIMKYEIKNIFDNFEF